MMGHGEIFSKCGSLNAVITTHFRAVCVIIRFKWRDGLDIDGRVLFLGLLELSGNRGREALV